MPRLLHKPILQRLRNVFSLYAVGSRQVGDRSRNLQHAVIAAGAQTELLGRGQQQRVSFAVRPAMRRDSAAAHVGVGARTIDTVACVLESPRAENSRSNRLRAFARCGVGDRTDGHGRHFDDEVQAITQRS